jgi:hypothetical protein
MASPIAVFITKSSTIVDGRTYDYSSHDSVFADGHGFVYVGQKGGGEDFKLLEAIDGQQKFFVYFRHKKTDNFQFMGSTRDAAAPFMSDNEPLQVMIAGNNMYATSIRSNPGMTKKEDALVDFMERNGIYGVAPSGVNLMKGFYLLNEVVDPRTFRGPLVDTKKAYNWDIHTPFSAARLVYC